MKPLHTWVFCISLLIGMLTVNGQEKGKAVLNSIDSLELEEEPPLSLRFGIDLLKIIQSQTNKDYRGFEAVADFRISKDLYIASEVGNIEVTKQIEQVNFTAKGSYYKLGFDFNMFDNWQGMDNQVVLGLRLGSSSHNQFLNSYTLLDRSPFWEESGTKILSGFSTGERPNLNAFWLEFVAGFKIQILHNIYLGLSLRLNRLLSDTVPENFDNIYIPGFNKKTEENKFGASFNYTLTYRIPFKL